MDLAFPALAVLLEAWLHEPGPPRTRPSFAGIRKLLDQDRDALEERWSSTTGGWPATVRFGFGLACSCSASPLAESVPLGEILDSVPQERLGSLFPILEGFGVLESTGLLMPSLSHPGFGAEVAAWLLAEFRASIPLGELAGVVRARIWSREGRLNVLCLVPVVIREDAGKMFQDILPTLSGDFVVQAAGFLEDLGKPDGIIPQRPRFTEMPFPGTTGENDSGNKLILTGANGPGSSYGDPVPQSEDEKPGPPSSQSVGLSALPTSSSPARTQVSTVSSASSSHDQGVRKSTPPRPRIQARPPRSSSLDDDGERPSWLSRFSSPAALLIVLGLVLLINHLRSDPLQDRSVELKPGERFWIDAVSRRPVTESFLMADKEYRMGEIFRIRGRFSDAQEFFRAAISIDPNHVEAQDRLGYCMYRLNSFEMAEAQFRKALQIDPSFFRSHFYLGRLHLRSQRWEDALSEFRHAFNAKRELAQIGIEYLRLLIQLGLFEEARPVAAELVNRFPTNQPLAQLQAQIAKEGR